MVTQKEDEVIISNFNEISLKDISKLLNKNYKSVCNRSRILGLSNNKRGKSKFSRTSKRKYLVNDNYFYILNEENCYWAGFLAADGFIKEISPHNKTLGCMLSSKDESHLIKFLKSIDSNNPVTHSISNGFPTSKIEISSTSIVNDLKTNFSLVQRKSLVLKPPKIYSEDLIDAFIIGYIDGDGCIGLYDNNLRINIIGSNDIIEWIKIRCDKITNSSSNIITKGNIKSICYNGSHCRILYKYLYNINVSKLERKWKKEYFDHCINYIHPHTKINEENSLDIFKLYENGVTREELSKKYNVHRGTIDRTLRKFLNYNKRTKKI